MSAAFLFLPFFLSFLPEFARDAAISNMNGWAALAAAGWSCATGAHRDNLAAAVATVPAGYLCRAMKHSKKAKE